MIVLGILLLIYTVAAYVFFWRALNHMEPRTKVWINIISAIVAFFLGPAIFIVMVVRAFVDPRYQPIHVIIMPVGSETNGRYQVDWKGSVE